ncbi:MAG: hypothetical protein KIT09_13660 [Bryobacteraceae bacterium]|nr:hypothetical protein [Bryobacteraceae bacterium]
MVLTLLGGQPGITQPSFAGGGSTIPRAAALDPEGNIWIAGSTDSEDFKLVNPIIATKVAYRITAFVAKLDPTGQKLLFSTYLGAQTPQPDPLIRGSVATALAIDNAGNVYVGGETADRDFPARGGFNGCRVFFEQSGDRASCSFLAKITPAGTLAYSTTVTTGGGCTGSNSSCIGRSQWSATVSAMVVDDSGAVTMAGGLGSIYHFPYGFISPAWAYVCRVAPDGSRLLWNLTTTANTLLPTLDATGEVHLFGQSVPVKASPPGSPLVYGTPVLFTDSVKADGSGFTGRKVLAESEDANAIGISPDKQGNLYLAGTSASSDFPLASGAPNPGTDFILKVDPSGSPVQPVLRLPHGAINAPPAFDSNGRLMLLGMGGALLTVPNDYYGQGAPAVVAFANAASFAVNTGICPGALLTLYGFNLPFAEQGFQVQVNGRPAPILYAGPNQINLQTPFETPEYGQISVTVLPGNLSVQVENSPSIGIFTVDGVHAAALNQDGTVNSQSNPAPGGSVISLFGTGARWPFGMTDGEIPDTPSMLDPDLNKFEALNTNQTPLAILYVGTAPGIINGVFQTNVLLPPNFSNLPRTYGIVLNGRSSRGDLLSSNVVQIYFK